MSSVRPRLPAPNDKYLMLYIAYRGLFEGENPQTENTPDQIGSAFNNGYSVMVDLWRVNNKLYLGSYEPLTEVTERYVQGNRFWINAKNVDCQIWLTQQPSKLYPHYFYQPYSSIPYVSTSDGHQWNFAEFSPAPYDNNSIVCQPEITDRGLLSTVHYRCYAVCSIFLRFIQRIRNEGGSPYGYFY